MLSFAVCQLLSPLCTLLSVFITFPIKPEIISAGHFIHASCFPAGTEIGVFHNPCGVQASVWCARICQADFRNLGSVFSWQGAVSYTCLAHAQQCHRAIQSTLATHAQLSPHYTHFHHREGQCDQMMGLQGSGLRRRRALVPSASEGSRVLLKIKKCCEARSGKLHRLV